jgi:hypothetical protein
MDSVETEQADKLTNLILTFLPENTQTLVTLISVVLVGSEELPCHISQVIRRTSYLD